MMQTFVLPGLFPDCAVSPWEEYLYVSTVIQSKTSDGKPDNHVHFYRAPLATLQKPHTGLATFPSNPYLIEPIGDSNGFPKLMAQDGVVSVVLQKDGDVWLLGYGDRQRLGPAYGNDGWLLAEGYVAWQERASMRTRIRSLFETAATQHVGAEGLSRLLFDGGLPQVRLRNEDRDAVPGMLNPVWAKTSADVVVGEHLESGVVVQWWGEDQDRLLEGELTYSPRCDQYLGVAYIVTYGPYGVYLVVTDQQEATA